MPTCNIGLYSNKLIHEIQRLIEVSLGIRLSGCVLWTFNANRKQIYEQCIALILAKARSLRPLITARFYWPG